MSRFLATREQDLWRAVEQRRVFEGEVCLAELGRVADLLAETDRTCTYVMTFDQDDDLGWPLVHIKAHVGLPLLCQRSLDVFDLPVTVDRCIGLMRDESQDALLPAGWEGFLMPKDGLIKPIELLEDELILAVPVIPVDPASEALVEQTFGSEELSSDTERENPFAVLKSMKFQPKAD